MSYTRPDQLLAVNRKWVASRKRGQAAPSERPDGLPPAYMVVSCCDNPIPIFQSTRASPADFFEVRNLANQISSDDYNLVEALDFALNELRVRHIIVCGHTDCHCIRGVIRKMPPHIDASYYGPIRDLYERNLSVLDRIASVDQQEYQLASLNVEWQLHRLTDTEVFRDATAKGSQPSLHGWLMTGHEGLIEDLGYQVQSPSLIRPVH